MQSILKEDFKKLRKVCESIDILKREIASIEARSDIVGDTYRDYRSGSGIVKKFTGLIDVQRKKERLDELEKCRDNTIFVMEKIRDDLTRDVMKKRYIDGMTWQQIAKAEGHPEKPDYYRIVIHDKFFREHS